MAETMSQQGFGLSVPSSRQDVISALLNDYGNSFGRGDVSTSAYSPVPSEKELPPPPPRSNSLDKPLPAVQRAEQRMSMKFQLRVIEDAPLSPNTISKDPSSARARRKIPFRSLSRDGKPPSLSLITSNGSTAIVPPTPALSTRSQTFPMSSKSEMKDLPSPPPPPPEKSSRRSNVQKATPTLKQSKSQSDLARNDSLLSQDESRPSATERPATVEAVPVVKRKALPVPAPAAKKFVGLAQLGAGPRGGKGGPLPPTSAPRKRSVDAGVEEAKAMEKEAEPKMQGTKQYEGPSVNQMPPTPEDDKFAAPAPAPPRKVFPGLGLPSNPRAKGGAISPKHVRGKSSTGFNLLKAQRPAPPPPTKIMETLTPEMTPSPTLKAAEPKEQAISPLSPLPPPTEQRRPFSFEPIGAPKPPPKSQEQPKTAVPIYTPVVTAPPAEPASDINTPLRPTSADLPEPSPLLHSPLSAALIPAANPYAPVKLNAVPAANPYAPAALNAAPAPIAIAPERQPSPPPAAAIAPEPRLDLQDQQPPTPPPFAPLTRAPIPLPQDLIPALAPAHFTCYTAHQTTTWSNNTFQPMGCMICRANDRERKWCCTWCQLRICARCSEELMMVPGRNLDAYLRVREEMGEREKVLSAVFEKDEDFS